MAIGDEAQPVAIRERRGTRHIERVVPKFLNLAHILAEGLRCVKTGNVGLTALEKICSISAVESLLQIGMEMIVHSPRGGTAIDIGMTAHQLIQPA